MERSSHPTLKWLVVHNNTETNAPTATIPKDNAIAPGSRTVIV
jgi:hypothetical protein